MFDRVTIRAADRERSERFYRTVLPALAVASDDFAIGAAGGDGPVTRRLHIGFAAPSRAAVDAFWRAGVDAGFADDGPPGPRPQYSPSYYGGFLRDPDGNSAEAVHRDGLRADGVVDHLWMRVADLGAARRFYADVAPRAGLRLGTDTDERVSFVRDGAGGGTFSLVPGAPTEHLQLVLGGVHVVVGPGGAPAEAGHDPRHG